MPDLLFISDNPKLEQVKDLLQPMLKLEIGVTTHLEYALEDIRGHQPSVICIQEQIAGKTAAEIAGQIRTVPENSPPLFVLLRGGDTTTAPPGQPFEHAIDLDLPVEQLANSILRVVLMPAFKLRRKDICIPHEQDGLATAHAHEETEPAGANAGLPKGEIPVELLKAFEHNYRSRRRNRWMKYAAVSLTVCLAVFGWYLTSGRPGQGGNVSQPLPARPVVQRPVAAPAPQIKKENPTTTALSSAAIVRKAPSAPRKPAANKVTTLPF